MADTAEILLEEDWKLFKDEGDEGARERLAKRYLPLVKTIIDRIAYKLPDHIEKEDLVSEGILGLIDAIDKYDPSRVNKFETYATVRIRGAVLDSLRHMDWVPRTLRQKSKEIENAFGEVERQLGRACTDHEVAEHLGITVEELRDTLSRISSSVVFSFEELLQMSDDDKPLPFMTRIKNQQVSDPSDSLIKSEMRRILVEKVEQLPKNEKLLIGLYYVEGLTLKQIGKVLGVTESRACQIHAKAVVRLKNAVLSGDKEINQD